MEKSNDLRQLNIVRLNADPRFDPPLRPALHGSRPPHRHPLAVIQSSLFVTADDPLDHLHKTNLSQEDFGYPRSSDQSGSQLQDRQDEPNRHSTRGRPIVATVSSPSGPCASATRGPRSAAPIAVMLLSTHQGTAPRVVRSRAPKAADKPTVLLYCVAANKHASAEMSVPPRYCGYVWMRNVFKLPCEAIYIALKLG
jgi:hypothetical protein